MIPKFITIVVLGFIQNTSFSIASRSRNRDNMRYHIIASAFSNTIWFMTMRELVLSEMTFILFIPYAVGTVSGSVFGAKLSMIIENWIGAKADSN